jgi:NAD(P)H-nitrite reductase large subunit
MRYVIVGAGPAGVIAAETLRKCDPQGEITLIGDEHSAPYSRMAIPYFLANEIPEDGMALRKEKGHFETLKIRYVQAQVSGLDPKAKAVKLRDGKSLPYDRLLIATGSLPTAPPIPGLEGPGIHPCWTIQDAREIHKLAAPGSHVVLIGAGFIGAIILDALFATKVKLTVLEKESRMVPRMLNEPAAQMLKRWCESRGVTVLTSTGLKSVAKGKSKRFALTLDKGGPLEADLVIVATGVRPRTDFLRGSGIELGAGGGVRVDQRLRSSVADVYAAGDVAEGRDFSTGLAALHAIQPTASEHGRVAALNMAGQGSDYQGSLIMNVLDTVGLVSYSFGQWAGVPGGDHAERIDADGFKYVRLEFQRDRLVGALAVGAIEGVGLLRGLIQSNQALGPWKAHLKADPSRIGAAYMGLHQMARVPALRAG